MHQLNRRNQVSRKSAGFFGVSASVPDTLQIYYLYLQKVG